MASPGQHEQQRADRDGFGASGRAAAGEAQGPFVTGPGAAQPGPSCPSSRHCTSRRRHDLAATWHSPPVSGGGATTALVSTPQGMLS